MARFIIEGDVQVTFKGGQIRVSGIEKIEQVFEERPKRRTVEAAPPKPKPKKKKRRSVQKELSWPEVDELVMSLNGKGLIVAEIARRAGVSPSKVYDVLSKHGLPTNGNANLKLSAAHARECKRQKEEREGL